MPWTEDERATYGAELASEPGRDRLRGIVEDWLRAHPADAPIVMVQWMRDTVGHDPFALFDEDGLDWLRDTLYGDLGSDDVLASALFSGLDAGP